MNKSISVLIIMIISISVLLPLINVNATPVYYGNFKYSTLLQSNGFIKKWIVYNQTTIYNDNPNFFSVWSWGSGSITASGSDDPVIKYLGSLSTKLNVYSGSEQGINMDNTILSTQNWSVYNTISIWIYGTNSGSSFYFRLDAPNGSNQLRYSTYNNFTGWHEFIIPFSDFISYNGSPNLSSVEGIHLIIENAAIGDNNLHIDDIFITSNYYYQIWDSSTLKYTGLSNPDINDFITTVSPIQTVVNNDWFYLLMLFAIFIISIISYKISILILPTFILDLWLILNKNYYLPNMSLLYMILLILSIFMALMSLTKKD